MPSASCTGRHQHVQLYKLLLLCRDWPLHFAPHGFSLDTGTLRCKCVFNRAQADSVSLKLAPQVLERRINWLNSIREWQQEFLGNLTPGEFVNCVMDDLLGRSVFVFTPSGQVMRLSRVRLLADGPLPH